MPIGLITLSTSMLAALCWMYLYQYRKTKRGRAGLLDECALLLETPRLTCNEAGYAELRGFYRGFTVRMTLEEDHAVMRKIPSLWLHIAVQKETSSVHGSLDMLVRPQGTECYSPGWDWDGDVTPLPMWPEHAVYRTRSTPPDLRAIDAFVQRLFTDAKTKELLVLPRLTRLTYQAKQAIRGEYLILRATAFDDHPLPRECVENLLEHVVDMRQHLEALSA